MCKISFNAVVSHLSPIFVFRPFGTIHLLATLTCEVVQTYVIKNDDEQTWSSEALDIMLEIWTVILGVFPKFH